MDTWESVYAQVIRSLNSDILFFRGHANSSWKLLPSLGRENINYSFFKEQASFFDFMTRAGERLQHGETNWQVAFSMQHHGMPTRLLDWTETFATALYFAMRDAKPTDDCCVWILNPFDLNSHTMQKTELLRPSDLNGDYTSYFIERTKTLEGNCVAISPLRHHPRVFNQRSGFTIHNDLKTPLETICPDALEKIVIPPSAHEGARKFLTLSGVTEYLLFPDLDGLARELNSEHFQKEFS